MKSGRRHELQTNVLADFLGQEYKKYSGYLYYLGIGVGVVLLLIVGAGYWQTSAAGKQAAAWAALYDAATADELASVTEQHAGSVVALWARVDKADARFVDGLGRYDRDKKNAESLLREALATYQEVLKATGLHPAMHRRALVGEARCLETLGEREKAIQRYRDIAKQFPDTALAKDAASRASDLESKDAADFYVWFVAYTPPEKPAGSPTLPGSDLLKDLPGLSGGGSKEPASKPEESPKTDAEPAKSKTDAEPAKSKTDAEPAKSKTDAEPAKPKTDAEPAKPTTDAAPAKPKADAEPAKSAKPEAKTDTKDKEIVPADSQKKPS